MNTSTIFIKATVKIKYKKDSFSNKEFGDSFLKGGSAREAAIKILEGGKDVEVRPRDLDIFLGEDDDSPLYYYADSRGEDYRLRLGRSPQTILEEEDCDVNLNKVLLCTEGLWLHREAWSGIRNRAIWRWNEERAGKRAIRAHFFAFRLGMRVVDGSWIDKSHSYLETVALKAIELGILEGWVKYLGGEFFGHSSRTQLHREAVYWVMEDLERAWERDAYLEEIEDITQESLEGWMEELKEDLGGVGVIEETWVGGQEYEYRFIDNFGVVEWVYILHSKGGKEFLVRHSGGWFEWFKGMD